MLLSSFAASAVLHRTIEPVGAQVVAWLVAHSGVRVAEVSVHDATERTNHHLGLGLTYDDTWLGLRVHAAYTVIASFLSLVPPSNTEARRMLTTNLCARWPRWTSWMRWRRCGGCWLTARRCR